MTNIHWRKSTRCGPDNGCVELARLGSQIAVRDSKDRHGSPVLRFGRSAFSSFVADIKLSRSAGRGGSRSSGTTNPARAPHGVVSAPEQANLPQAGVSLPAGASGSHDGALREPRRWRIEFPAGMELLTSNFRSKHWAPGYKIGTAIKEAAIVLCRDVLKIPRLERVSIVAEYQKPTKGRSPVREVHNLAPTAKYAIDGVVKAGVLRDDADTYVADLIYRPGVPYPLGRFVLVITEVLENN